MYIWFHSLFYFLINSFFRLNLRCNLNTPFHAGCRKSNKGSSAQNFRSPKTLAVFLKTISCIVKRADHSKTAMPAIVHWWRRILVVIVAMMAV